jgi:serine/threonine protein kinase
MIERELGRGGMGVVYKAYEESLQRDVAIKILPRSLSSDQLLVKRFQREAQASARLDHPGIADIYEVGQRDGIHFIAMEYVEGETLAERLTAEIVLSLDEVIRITQEIACALAEAHNNGIVHRDIKPQNIMIDAKGHARVLDFGLAQIAATSTQLTAEQKILGTPAFMAPEQCKGSQVDHRSDIYSLGATFYTMLTGDLPYTGSSPMVVMYQITHEPFPELDDILPDDSPGVPQALRNMVAKDISRRYQSTDDLVQDLEGLLNDSNYDVAPQGLGYTDESVGSSLPQGKNLFDQGKKEPLPENTDLTAASPVQSKRSSLRISPWLIAILSVVLLAVGGSIINFAWLARPSVNLAVTYAVTTGGTGYERGSKIVVDASGNAYVTGTFSGTVDFNPGEATHELSTMGGEDIYIQKLDPQGNLMWAHGFGSAFDDEWGIDIDLDSEGNVYAVGYFAETVDFDPGPATFNLTSKGGREIFVLKLDADGTFATAWQMGGPENDWGIGIDFDSRGNMYVTGRFTGTGDFDPSEKAFSLTSIGNGYVNVDTFICKLDAFGNFLWAKNLEATLAAPNPQSGFAIAPHPSNGFYLGGNFYLPTDADPGPSEVILNSEGGTDIVISKFDDDGNLIWAKATGGAGTDWVNDIASDSQGNVYATGHISETVDLDPSAKTANFTSTGAYDQFIRKMDSDGRFLWGRVRGGYFDEIGDGIAVDARGNVYTAGSGGSLLGREEGPDFDIVLEKTSPSGDLVWSRTIGGIGHDVALGIAVDPRGNVYSTGMFQEEVDFDPGDKSAMLGSAGGFDSFVLKLEQNAGSSEE